VPRYLLIAVLALVPVLAAGKAPADAGFTAVDFAWRANGTDATTLTIAPGGTVSFGYPAGAAFHNVDFTGAKPTSCANLPPGPRPKGWQGACTFDDPGTYEFVCDVHAEMTGSVVVAAPTPVPTETASPDPVASPTPAPTAAPPTVQTTLAVMVAPKQRGTRVRGTVDIKQAASKLEVTVTTRLGKTVVRVGHSVTASTPSGPVTFSVALDAKARRALRDARKLTVTVAVALTPPGGTKLVHSAKASIRPR
jgi:plastocyanin